MNSQQIAQILDGSDYRNIGFMPIDLIKSAVQSNLVIAYLSGAEDEIILLGSIGGRFNIQVESVHNVNVDSLPSEARVYCDITDSVWKIKSLLPHQPFNVYDRDRVFYCGCVIELAVNMENRP